VLCNTTRNPAHLARGSLSLLVSMEHGWTRSTSSWAGDLSESAAIQGRGGPLGAGGGGGGGGAACGVPPCRQLVGSLVSYKSLSPRRHARRNKDAAARVNAICKV